MENFKVYDLSQTTTTITTTTATTATRTTIAQAPSSTSTATTTVPTLTATITSTTAETSTTSTVTSTSSSSLTSLSHVVVLGVDVVNDSFVGSFNLSQDSLGVVFNGFFGSSRAWSDNVRGSVFFCLEAMNLSTLGSRYVTGLDSSSLELAPVLSGDVGGFQDSVGSFNGSVGLTGLGLYRLVGLGDGVLVNRSIRWLVERQNVDGGWAQEGFNCSNFYASSHAVGGLVYAYVNGFVVDEGVLESGVSYLMDETYVNGSWLSFEGSGDYSATHKVCETLLVLLFWDSDNPLVESGVQEIKRRRLSDGSWGHHPSHTAVCSWALSEYQKVSE